jgi:hypothetical protein
VTLEINTLSSNIDHKFRFGHRKALFIEPAGSAFIPKSRFDGESGIWCFAAVLMTGLLSMACRGAIVRLSVDAQAPCARVVLGQLAGIRSSALTAAATARLGWPDFL